MIACVSELHGPRCDIHGHYTHICESSSDEHQGLHECACGRTWAEAADA